MSEAAPVYPAEPWELHGHNVVGIWFLPKQSAPPPPVGGTRSIGLFGRRVVAAGFFVYEEPSPLTYAEVMATVLVRKGLRPRVSITHIWVDSPASRRGGRELWGIPKDLAAFDVDGTRHYAAQGIGSVRVDRVRRAPWRLPLAFRIAQDHVGRLLVSPVRGTIRPALVRACWRFEADGPLAFLAGREPVLSLAALPFHLVFGRHGP